MRSDEQKDHQQAVSPGKNLMEQKEDRDNTVFKDQLHPALQKELSAVRKGCTECRKCVSQCAFLKKYGTPGRIAGGEYGPSEYMAGGYAAGYRSENGPVYGSVSEPVSGSVSGPVNGSIDGSVNESGHEPDYEWLTISYECSLCNLCEALCPEGLSPGAMFLEMRRESVLRGVAPFEQHKTIINYEKRGTSKRYSWYSLPENCDTVLFPGCTFAATRSDSTLALYESLRKNNPSMGIVLDCCCKPSHDLGRSAFFDGMFNEMRSWLEDRGVRNIIVVCPNCYKVFKKYGSPLQVVTAYEYMVEDGLEILPEAANGEARNSGITDNFPAFAIHDPCVLREEPEILSSVRKLAENAGFELKEMRHSGRKTLCCGEGGSVGFIAPDLASEWRKKRVSEAAGTHLITCCAGCAGMLGRSTPTDHIIDAVLDPESVRTGKRRVTKPPFTYMKRLLLKRTLRKKYPAAVTRERDFYQTENEKGEERDFMKSKNKVNPAAKGGNLIKKYLILIIIASAAAAIHFTGVANHLDQESLRNTVSSWGILAPAVYILIYSIAPALFLPGLPITVAGGILFGPLWGVVYAITGATIGASIAFLISRYVAREWIESKLSSPKWKQLDESVEKNGWKIVAFTRLVPLFPFNLLNYAFGLTSITFGAYAVTSFICMLPACIAFIVFSSSLLDLLKGELSTGVIAGLALIVIVSLIPVIIKKYSKNKRRIL